MIRSRLGRLSLTAVVSTRSFSKVPLLGGLHRAVVRSPIDYLYNSFHSSFMAPTKQKSKKKVYAVAVGRRVGLVYTWNECSSLVKGYPGAKFKGFTNTDEAQQFLDQYANGSNDKQTKKNTSSTQKRPASETPAVTATSSLKRPRLSLPPHDYIRHIRVHIMFDGGSRGNPGTAGAGALIVTQHTDRMQSQQQQSSVPPTKEWKNRTETRVRKYMPQAGTTNNQAEYQGLISGLEVARRNVQDILERDQKNNNDNNYTPEEPNSTVYLLSLIVQGDSQLIIKQITKEYECRSPLLQPYLKRVRTILQQLSTLDDNTIKNNIVFQPTWEHVLRKFNTQADALANEAMDAQRSWETVTIDGEAQEQTPKDNVWLEPS